MDTQTLSPISYEILRTTNNGVRFIVLDNTVEVCYFSMSLVDLIGHIRSLGFDIIYDK